MEIAADTCKFSFVNDSLKNQLRKLLAKGVSTEDAILEEVGDII